MLGTYVIMELVNPLTKCTLLVLYLGRSKMSLVLQGTRVQVKY